MPAPQGYLLRILWKHFSTGGCRPSPSVEHKKHRETTSSHTRGGASPTARNAGGIVSLPASPGNRRNRHPEGASPPQDTSVKHKRDRETTSPHTRERQPWLTHASGRIARTACAWGVPALHHDAFRHAKLRVPASHGCVSRGSLIVPGWASAQEIMWRTGFLCRV